MSDLIERDKTIEAIENVDWYHQNRNKDMVSGANDDEHQAWYKADDIYKALESVPSARPKEELTDVLAELHERFDALEKELRKASAEMSTIIREYVDRPQGEWMSEGRAYPPTNAYHSAYCSHCGEWSEYLTDYCGNCGADMREREGE